MERVSSPRIGAVILDWNKPYKTRLCAESVLAEFDRLYPDIDCMLVIVDNGSELSSFEKTQRWVNSIADNRVSLLRNHENYGFAKGMNYGLKVLEEHSPDYVWLLNNDLSVAPDSLRKLFELSEKDRNLCIVGPTVVKTGSDLVQCAGGCRYLPWLGLERPLEAGKELSQLNTATSRNLHYVYGASMFVRASFLTSIGGLNEQYFLFYEELELSLSLKGDQAMAWCPSSIVYHDGSKSEHTTKKSRAFTAYHAALSAFLFTRRHYPWCLPTVVLARIIGLGANGIRQGNLALATAPWKALVTWLRQSA